MDRLSFDNLRTAKELIQTLDLNAVIERLVYIDGWSKADALKACEQYKNYLFLRKKYGNSCLLPPSNDIDEVWHAHILHTEDYTTFCLKVFGYFLHHHPHLKQEGIQSQQHLEQLFEEQTQRFYFEEFGEYIHALRTESFFNKLRVACKQFVSQARQTM